MESSKTERQGLIARYRAIRGRTEGLFSMISSDAFWSRPIPLRHPICFYRGHLAAFDVNTLLKRGLARNGVRDGFEKLFERGIDPKDAQTAESVSIQAWPERSEIEEYVSRVDALVEDSLREIEESGETNALPWLAAQTCLEHQEMHQETLMYIFHRLPLGEKTRPVGYALDTDGAAPERSRVRIPAGRATLGADRGRIPFGWDNEFPRLDVEVPAFEIERDDVTNADFVEFLEAGGYDRMDLWEGDDWEWRRGSEVEHPVFWSRESGSWKWRAMFEEVDLPLSWPVYVSLAEARAYARWKGLRLPTEAEYHRAAYATADGRQRPFPWGDDPPDPSRGNFDFARFDPVPVGSYAAGSSAFGVRDMLGNGWEWTATPWRGFPGFEPMATYPQYSSDFFDGRHFVMKGGSPVTAVDFLRRSFRNWFQAHYPYPYATFRCARSSA
jgi:iron(II)-dependent oxidoreductase